MACEGESKGAQSHFSILRSLESKTCRWGTHKSFLVRLTKRLRREATSEGSSSTADASETREETGPIMELNQITISENTLKTAADEGSAGFDFNQVFQEEWLRKDLFGAAGGEGVVRAPIKVWSSTRRHEKEREVYVLLPFAEESDGVVPENPPENNRGTEEFEEAIERREAFLDKMELKISTVAQMHAARLAAAKWSQEEIGVQRAVSFTSAEDNSDPSLSRRAEVQWSERELFQLLSSAASHIKILHQRGFVHGFISASALEVERIEEERPRGEDGGSSPERARAGSINASPAPKDPKKHKSTPTTNLSFRLRHLYQCVDRQLLQDDPSLALNLLGYTDRAQFPSQKPPHLAPELHRWIKYAHVWKDDPTQNSFIIRDWQAIDMYHLGLTVLELALGIDDNDCTSTTATSRGGGGPLLSSSSPSGGEGTLRLPNARSHLWENFLSMRISNAHGHLSSLLDSLSDRGYSSNLQAFLSQLLQSSPSKRPSPDVVATCMSFLQVEKSIRRSERDSQRQSQSRRLEEVTPSKQRIRKQGDASAQTAISEQTLRSPTVRQQQEEDSREQKFALRSVSHYCAAQRREIRKVLNSAADGTKAGERAQKQGGGAAPPKLTGIHHHYYLQSDTVRNLLSAGQSVATTGGGSRGQNTILSPSRPVSAQKRSAAGSRASTRSQKIPAPQAEEMFV